MPISGRPHLRILPHCLAAMTLFLSFSPSCSPSTQRYGVDLHGKPVSDLGGPGVRVVVLVFAASDCPISNRYVPEIARLNHIFSAEGARFWWVFPNPSDTAALVTQHVHDFSINESILLDPQQTMVRMAHATTTPEAVIFVAANGSPREVYRGRIDDRYIAFGEERPQPQHHELEAAIAAALAGKPVPEPAGPPVGCSIVFLKP